MAFLRSVNPLDIGPVLHAGPVYLRAPQMSDFHGWAELRAASKSFLSPWEPTWPRGFDQKLFQAPLEALCPRYAR